jgi:uncharacterized protein YgiM (DUF1202 family)
MKLTSLMSKRGRSQVFSKKRIAKRMLTGGARKSYSKKGSSYNYSSNSGDSSLSGCYPFLKWGCLIFFAGPIIFVMLFDVIIGLNTDIIKDSYNINQDVNFRSEASAESEILRVLEKDETVKILDSLNNWFKIEGDEKLIGFVSKSYVNKSVTIKKEETDLFTYYILFIVILFILYKSYNTKCAYCGKRCLVFTKHHLKCSTNAREATLQIEREVENYFKRFDEENFVEVNEVYSDSEFSKIEKIAEDNYIDLYLTLSKSLDSKVDQFLEDGFLSVNEESFLGHFIEQFNLNQKSYIDSLKIKHKIVKASILRNVIEGNPMSSRINLDGNLPFKFLNKEFLIYVDQSVEYFEKRIKTTYKGGSDGVSIKIMKGVYYRKSSFRGTPVKTLNTVSVGSGTLALTNKHLYFASSNKNFRVRFDRIVTITPFEDGIGVQKDGVSSKPMTFKNVDGWFYYNFIKNADKIVERAVENNANSSETRTRKISQSVKDKVWNRDQGKCVECGSKEKLEFDHIIPFSKGGANTYRNIQLLCEKCNREKSNNIG